MPVAGVHLCRSGCIFYGAVHFATPRAKQDGEKHIRTLFRPVAADFEFDDLTYTHALRMRWVRPDPLISVLRAQEAALLAEERAQEG